MAWPAKKHIERLIAQARKYLTNVQINVYDYDQELLRSVIKLEGIWKNYRVIMSEVHRVDGTTCYAYYVLTQDNKLVHGFDNSGDRTAVKLR